MKYIAVILTFIPLLLSARNPLEVLNDISPSTKIIQLEKKVEIELIYNWLSNTPELRIHQLRGATKNEVYLHQDGHREAVYDSEGIVVQDGINDGSYNYAHPTNDPLHHFAYDILPWIMLGNSREDPGSVQNLSHFFWWVYGEGFGLGFFGCEDSYSGCTENRPM